MKSLSSDDPLDVGTALHQLAVKRLVPTIEMVDAVDGGFAFGDKGGEDQAHRCAQVGGHYFGAMQPFNDAMGLIALLAKSPEVRTCFAGEWSRFALGRLDTDADAASLQATAMAFNTDTATIQDLLAAVATMRSFRYRSPSPGEMQ